jgi:hypothetical protein
MKDWARFFLDKKLWFIGAIFFFSTIVFCRNENINADSTKKLKVIVFYEWGFPNFNGSEIYDKCEDSIQNKYGFKYKRVGGCTIGFERIKWNWHNKRAENAMKRRHGKQWYLNYNSELNKCCCLK